MADLTEAIRARLDDWTHAGAVSGPARALADLLAACDTADDTWDLTARAVRESARARRKREERDALAPGSGQRQHPSNVAPPPLSTKPVPQRENTESEHGNSPES